MTEGDSTSRVTQRELYDELTGLRGDIAEGFDSLRREMRSTYAVSAVCEQKHIAVEDTINAAVAAGAADRQRIWEALHDNTNRIHDVTKKVYIGTGIAVAFSFAIPIAVSIFR